MRVLVVDDSADIRYIVRFLLEEAGIEVQEARTGQQAIDLLSGEHEIDAVVLDQRMPDRTGLEVAAHLPANCPPVILFSDYLHPSLQAEADRAGVIRVNKSDLNQLADVVRGASSRSGG
jgi:CheY-like chemotaxis protein